MSWLAIIPAVLSGVSALSGLWSGWKSSQDNQKAMAQQDKQYEGMQALVSQMLGQANPNAYLHQAETVGQRMVNQLSADMASRGVLQSGAFARTSADTLSSLYADALAKAQNDRMAGYQAALGVQSNLAGAYGQRINPNPYGGLASGLQSAGNSAAWYLDYQAKHPNMPTTTTPTQSTTSSGFGVRYSSPYSYLLPGGK